MPIDYRVYQQLQAPNDIGSLADGLQRGFSMGDLYRRRREESAVKEAFRKNIKTNNMGKSELDKQTLTRDLYAVNPELGLKYEDMLTRQKALSDKSAYEQRERNRDILARVAPMMKDQGSYDKSLNYLQTQGYDTSGLPREYDPQSVKSWEMAGMPLKERMNLEFMQGIKGAELGLKRGEQQLRQDRFSWDRTQDIAKREQKLMENTDAASINKNLTEGERAADKAFGGEANQWEFKGRSNAQRAIEKLRELQEKVANTESGFFEPGGGKLRSAMPDLFRYNKSIEWRDDAQNFANVTLKELFGGQLSDAERSAAAREYWNDKLDNQSNAKRLADKIEDLERASVKKDKMVRAFRKNRTLRGWEEPGSPGGKKMSWQKLMKVKMSKKDREAFSWAQSNKKDKRAEKIMEKLENKYGGQ